MDCYCHILLDGRLKMITDDYDFVSKQFKVSMFDDKAVKIKVLK